MENLAFHAEQLGNGLRLRWLPRPHTRMVALVAAVRSGPLYETQDNHGVSHFLEHLHLATTPGHPTRAGFLDAVRAIPGTLNARSELDLTRYQFLTRGECLEAAGGILAEILSQHTVHPDVLESERRLLLNELAGSSPLAGSIPPYARFNGATGQALRAPLRIRDMSPEVVGAFDRAAYRPDQIVVAVVGDIQPALLDAVRGRLGAIVPVHGATLPLHGPPSTDVPKQTFSRSTQRLRRIQLDFVCRDALSLPERTACDIIRFGTEGYHSSLWESLRYGKSNTYAFGISPIRVVGLQVLSLFGAPDRTQRDVFLRNLLAWLGRMRRGEIDQVWFERARHNAYAALECRAERAEWLADKEVSGELRRPYEAYHPIAARGDGVRSVTVKQFHATIQSVINADRLAVFCDRAHRFCERRRVLQMVRGALG